MTTAEMTYSESAKGVQITHDRALVEIQRHGIYNQQDQLEGLAYARNQRGELYSASKLLEWLGY